MKVLRSCGCVKPGAVVPLIAAILITLAPALRAQDVVVLDSGLGVAELAPGQGKAAQSGDIVSIHLKAWLNERGTYGKMVASTEDEGRPISFVLGTDRVLPAWNEGVSGMQVGGKRRLLVPHELGVGAAGEGQLVPEDTDVIFEIELLEIREPDSR